jgi:hypothetical protein
MPKNPSGYLHSDYAASLRFFGHPWALKQSGGWLLRRPIEGTAFFDAMGCYPLFTCRNWDDLHRDLSTLPPEWVSVSVVSDPLAIIKEEQIKKIFPDICYPYKEHLLIDLSQPYRSCIDSHHRRYARWSLKRVKVELCPSPAAHIDTWFRLYSNLSEKHAIRGIAKFSRTSFLQQLSLPGAVLFKADIDKETVGMLFWYHMGDNAYYHLGASNTRGYKERASFALFWESIEHFSRQGLHWLNLGAGAGWRETRQDGLTRFKRGWSNTSRPVYFCGKIINRREYQRLDQRRTLDTSGFFPSYRFSEWN